MKKRMWEMRTLFIPTIAIGLVIVLFPWLTFPEHPIYTVLYVYISVILFLALLRSKDSLPFNLDKDTERRFDKIVTIIIWIIAPPLFIFFGILAIVIVLLWKRSIYVVAFTFSLIVAYVLGIKLRVVGDLPAGQFIITPNHCSWVDDALDSILMKPKKWKVLFAKEIKRIIFAKFFLKFFGIPINREEMTSRRTVTRKMEAELKNGYNLLIKPEGRRLIVNNDKEKKQEHLLKFDDGAFFLSKITGVPILPAVISWTFLFKPRSGQWWYSPRTITIYYLDPMIITKGEDIEDFKERVRDSMLKVLEESIKEETDN